MRHSSCRTTIDIYTRAVSQQKREANLRVVERMLPLGVLKLPRLSAPLVRKVIRRCRQKAVGKGVVWWT